MKRNPAGALAMPKSMNQFFQGVGAMDALMALGGFAGAIMLPGAVIKVADTTGKKVGKLLLALGSTGVVGLAAKSISGISGARAAVAGGMAGSLAQSLAAFTDIQIGRQRLLGPGIKKRIGESRVVSPAFSREGETVSLITP